MWKRLLPIGLLALVVAGCGPRTQPATRAVTVPEPVTTTRQGVGPTPAPLPDDQLYLAGGYVSPAAAAGRSGWVILNTGGPAPERNIPAGVPSPDWSTMYTVGHVGDTTTVQAVDPATGQVRHTVTVAGAFDFPDGATWPLAGGLSPNGRWLTLQHNPSGREQTAYARAGQWQSHLVVLTTSFAQPPRQIDLAGSFTIDAVSDDGTSLYLIESVPSATVPDQYRVRRYDLAQSTLQPGAIADKTGADVMSGTRHAAVPSLDGHWLFSLYLNTRSGPFIHALNLTDRYALCIDLPVSSSEKTSPSALWSLALAPDGQTLYAANGDLGIVSAVEVASLRVVKTARFPVATAVKPPLQALLRWAVPQAQAKGVGSRAAVTPDGKTLYVLGQHGLFTLDAGTLALRGRQFADRPLADVAVSPEGRDLYLLPQDGGPVLVVDRLSGTVIRKLDTYVIPFAILHVAPPLAT